MRPTDELEIGHKLFVERVAEVLEWCRWRNYTPDMKDLPTPLLAYSRAVIKEAKNIIDARNHVAPSKLRKYERGEQEEIARRCAEWAESHKCGVTRLCEFAGIARTCYYKLIAGGNVAPATIKRFKDALATLIILGNKEQASSRRGYIGDAA